MFLVRKADYLPQGKMIGLRQGKIIYAGFLGPALPLDIDQLLLSPRDYDAFNRSLEKTRRSDSDVDPPPTGPHGNPTPNDNEARIDSGRPPSPGDPAQG